MPPSEFVGLNVVLIGLLAVVVLVYLVILIRKRRSQKFLHEDE